jgi:hypothetical protein
VIPAKIIRFLEQHGNAGLAGFRDRDLVPFGSRVCGWHLAADGVTLTLLMPSTFEARVLDAMRDNGRIAVTIEEYPLHETYQLKGHYISHRPPRPDEIDLVNRTRERFATNIRSLVTGEEPINYLRASIPPAGFAMEMRIEKVFVQTPGPGAGAPIYPTEL